MLTWEHILPGESFMNTGKCAAISLCRWCRFYMGNEVRSIGIAGFGQMHFVSNERLTLRFVL